MKFHRGYIRVYEALQGSTVIDSRENNSQKWTSARNFTIMVTK